MSSNVNVLGLDVGSVSIAIALLDPDYHIIKTSYGFHHGKVTETLESQLSGFDLASIGYISSTTSTPALVRHDTQYDNNLAVIRGASRVHPKIGSILLVGGEKFSLFLFDSKGQYQRSKTNTSCAAGTGSFLDQQAFRLNLPGIETLAETAYSNQREIPKIASRCAVFAKTDLIHAQQEGFTLEEICDGLCHGLAKNLVDTLFTGVSPLSPVIMSGGVSLNRSVIRHIANLIGQPLTVDGYSHLHGAIGAAACLLDEGRLEDPRSILLPADLIESKEERRSYYYPPLELTLSKYPDFASEKQAWFIPQKTNFPLEVEVEIYQGLENGQTLDVFLGIDVGSTSTKAVLTDGASQVLAGFYTKTAGRPLQAVQALFEAINDLAQKKGLTFNFKGTGTTGSGRKFIGKLIQADLIIDEITAHARAAYALNPKVDTIIEIGGQDSKFTTLKNGMVTFSVMNTVCAAGTGSFIEELASRLACPLTDYSSRAEGVSSPIASDRCTVFMERDLNHYLNKGFSVNEILGAVLHSIRDNYLSKVAVEAAIGSQVCFQGATGRNKALIAAFEQRLGRPIFVSKYCHLTGALGTAILLEESRISRSGFRGIDLYKQQIPIRSEVCELCTNHCKIKLASLENETVAYGFLCGRDYETKKFVNNNCSGFDLLKERRQAFLFKPETTRSEITIGLPAALHLLEDLPLWEKFFDLLGIKTLISRTYTEALKKGKALTGAEFCAPITALHGHIQHLADRTDFIFLPVYLEALHKPKGFIRKYCYYTQFAPSLVSNLNERTRMKCLVPLLDSNLGTPAIILRLYQALLPLKKGLSFFEVLNAYRKANEFFSTGLESQKELFKKTASDDGELQVVLFGRPYTIFQPAMNKGIPEIFGALGIKTFYQDMIAPAKDDLEAIEDLLKAFHWHYAAKILEAAEIVSKRTGLYPVLLTSFKCSPDSFLIEYFKRIFDREEKPYLILQLDEHDSRVGYETRIEAAIRAFSNHQARKQKISELKHLKINPRPVTKINQKTLLLPNWDPICCRFLTANFIRHGIDARVLEENETVIQQSLRHNTGQCLPLNTICQEFMDYIQNHHLAPEKTLLWMGDSAIACNIRLYPYYIKSILETRGGGLEKAGVYLGNIAFTDFSPPMAVAMYFAYMFGGLIKKIGCKIRPYERQKGQTDQTLAQAVEIIYDTFLGKQDREEVLNDVVRLFKKIEVDCSAPRPKVAIFGDLYTRDNDIMNQHLIQAIEGAGGEVITTPYSDYIKMVAEPYFKRWLLEKNFFHVGLSKTLLAIVNHLDRKYYQILEEVLKEPYPLYNHSAGKILSLFNVKVQHAGESLDNLIKVFSLLQHYPDIALFVQASPAFCCPSLVTEAMAKDIERHTGIPVVSITYDGTGSPKNEVIIPYIKYAMAKMVKGKKENGGIRLEYGWKRIEES